MGLPCAHYIKYLTDSSQGLILDDIHKHWWIQSVSHIYENTFPNEDSLQPLLQNLQERYQEWPKHQQIAAQATLDNMINAPLMTPQDPKIVPTKGRPFGATNKRPTNTTRRDPSGFELVERVRKCTLCHQSGHNSRTFQQRNNNII